MTVMEFRTGGPVREPRGPGVVAGLRGVLRRRREPLVVAEPRTSPDAAPAEPRAGRPA